MTQQVSADILEKAEEYIVHPTSSDVTDLPSRSHVGDVELVKGSVDDYKFDLEREEAIQREEVTKAHSDYLESHPELRQVVSDLLSSVLMDKPSNVYQYFADYFAGAK